MKKLFSQNSYAVIIFIGSLILIPLLGRVHLFDWDEINFAECAREMIATGDYLRVQIDYQPFWEKPPLFIWAQVLSMKIFGINEFASRLPNALIGIITLLVLFNIGKKVFNTEFGWTWCLVYLGSFLPLFYFRSGIIDPMFNLFMFLSAYFIYKNYLPKNKNRTPILLAGVFSGLAVLTKGPVGFLIPSITFFIFWIINRKEIKIPVIDAILFVITTVFVSLIWFGIEIISNGTWFINEFIKYQIRLLTTGDAGHSGPFYYHFVILLIGCFPASIFAFNHFRKGKHIENDQNNLRIIMIVLLAVVLVIFSIVTTKIIHYSSLAYYPITFLSTITIYDLIKEKRKLNAGHYAGIILLGLIYSVLLIALPLAFIYRNKLMPYITDDFVKGNLSMNVNWSGLEYLIGVLFLILLIVSVVFLFKQQYRKGLYLLFLNTIIALSLFLPIVVPKVEKHVQGAPIAFYESIAGEDVYLNVLGFKSYAHLFYSKKQYKNSSKALGLDQDVYEKWLKEGEIDKPVYSVCKVQDQNDYKTLPNIELMKEEGGFAFFKRLPKNK
ncbi:MAG: glycosyltransferase family 39 protein [Ignavibacteriales bacterium]|nr:glycosyltransferase family 39 protein [Ignavibacteriales bacterium]